MPDLARERLGTGAFMSTVCTARALPWRETAQVARRLDGLALMQVQGMAHAHARRARHRLSNGRPLSGLASLSRCVVRHTLTRCPKNERYAIGIFSFPIRAYCESVQQPAPPKSSALSPKSARRLDGKLENALTGAGIRGVDAGSSTERRTIHYSTARARAEYRGSWAARREIDFPARCLVQGGFELQDLPPGFDGPKIVSYCSDIGPTAVPEDRGVLAALARLRAEGNKGAGAALVVVVEDGLDPWLPLDLTRIKRVISLELLERDEITPWRGSSAMGGPEYYIIGTSRTTLTPSSIVHASRVILNKGARLSPSEEWVNQGWGASTLELLHTERQSMHMAHQEMGTLILRANIDVAYFAELSEMICEEESEGRTTGDIDARLALMSRSRGQHRLIPLDAGRAEFAEEDAARPSDRFERVGAPVEGIAKLAVAVENGWAAGTGQTPSIALGRNVGGLNTGDNAGDWQSWSSVVDGERDDWLIPRLDYLIEIVCASKEGPTGGRIPETWCVKMRPLWVPPPLEVAEERKLQAEADEIYARVAAPLGEEIYQQRLVEGATGELRLEPRKPPAAPPSLPPPEPEAVIEGEPTEVADARRRWWQWWRTG
jgi:hypothetical protein